MADTKIKQAIGKLILCRDGLSELYDKTVDNTDPEIYGAIMGLHQLVDEALVILREMPEWACQEI